MGGYLRPTMALHLATRFGAFEETLTPKNDWFEFLRGCTRRSRELMPCWAGRIISADYRSAT